MSSLKKGHSCILCQQRKVRCDQQKPCANCLRARVECRVVAAPLGRWRKKGTGKTFHGQKTLHKQDLITQIRKYESLLSQHGIRFDSILEEKGEEDGDAGDDHGHARYRHDRRGGYADVAVLLLRLELIC